MDPFRNLPQAPGATPPRASHVLPPAEQGPEEPIGPGDLEIEFEPESGGDDD